MTVPVDYEAELLAAIPRLRAFAVSLTGRTPMAEDLVQETLARAWGKMDMFVPGTNFLAWLYTILRNLFYSELRRTKREVEDNGSVHAANRVSLPAQEGYIEYQDFLAAFAKLAPDHRVALILVGASGLSYDDAAKICDCALGTMKSRVNRARAKLAEYMGEPMTASGARKKLDFAA